MSRISLESTFEITLILALKPKCLTIRTGAEVARFADVWVHRACPHFWFPWSQICGQVVQCKFFERLLGWELLPSINYKLRNG